MSDIYQQVCALNFAETGHDEPWRNRVASDLNELLGRAQFWLETDNDESDDRFAKAVLSICQRVREFDDIKTCTQEQLIAMQKAMATACREAAGTNQTNI